MFPNKPVPPVFEAPAVPNDNAGEELEDAAVLVFAPKSPLLGAADVCAPNKEPPAADEGGGPAGVVELKGICLLACGVEVPGAAPNGEDPVEAPNIPGFAAELPAVEVAAPPKRPEPLDAAGFEVSPVFPKAQPEPPLVVPPNIPAPLVVPEVPD